VLDQAEDIVNAIGAQVLADVAAEAERADKRGVRRFFRRRKD
jgi:hypothetical protein